MSVKRTDVVLVKLGAALIAILTLRYFSTYLGYYVSTTDWPAAAFGVLLLSFLVPIAIAWVLWFFPATIVGAISENDTPSDAEPISARALLTIGISLLGLFVLIDGILDVIFWETTAFIENSRNLYERSVPPQEIANRITNIARLLIGVGLVMGRAQLVNLLYKIRNAGGGAT